MQPGSAAGPNRSQEGHGIGTRIGHGRRFRARLGMLVAALIGIAGCMPTVHGSGPPVVAPALGSDHVVMADGARLPLRRWLPDGEIEAVVVALHGFTDYSHAFAGNGPHLAGEGIAFYAYDQRGFGGAPAPGRWPGIAALVADLRQVVHLVQAEHPGRPVFLLGESMGGAVILAAAPELDPEEIAGLVLVAPAVWGWSVMNPALASLLQLLAHAVPNVAVSARPLRALASDNTAMLAALERDPLVLQKVRIDALYGLVTLMDQALAAAERIQVPTLVLYGANERLIPWKAQAALFQRLPADHRIVIYPAGHHTLLRDLEAARVHDDVTKWIRQGPHKAPADLAFHRHARNCLGTTWKGCPPCRDHRPGA
jgi:acylglycerol lipase